MAWKTSRARYSGLASPALGLALLAWLRRQPRHRRRQMWSVPARVASRGRWQDRQGDVRQDDRRAAPAYDDAELQTYVDRIGQRLVANSGDEEPDYEPSPSP